MLLLLWFLTLHTSSVLPMVCQVDVTMGKIFKRIMAFFFKLEGFSPNTVFCLCKLCALRFNQQVLCEHANISDVPLLWLGFLSFGRELFPFLLTHRLIPPYFFFPFAMIIIVKHISNHLMVAGSACVADE